MRQEKVTRKDKDWKKGFCEVRKLEVLDYAN